MCADLAASGVIDVAEFSLVLPNCIILNVSDVYTIYFSFPIYSIYFIRKRKMFNQHSRRNTKSSYKIGYTHCTRNRKNEAGYKT